MVHQRRGDGPLSPPAGSVGKPLLYALAALAGLPLIAAGRAGDVPGGSGFALSGQVIAGGGTRRAVGACFSLAGTIGQPLAGHAAYAAYALDTGFWAAPQTGDRILTDGFDACPRSAPSSHTDAEATR